MWLWWVHLRLCSSEPLSNRIPVIIFYGAQKINGSENMSCPFVICWTWTVLYGVSLWSPAAFSCPTIRLFLAAFHRRLRYIWNFKLYRSYKDNKTDTYNTLELIYNKIQFAKIYILKSTRTQSLNISMHVLSGSVLMKWWALILVDPKKSWACLKSNSPFLFALLADIWFCQYSHHYDGATSRKVKTCS